MSLVSAVFANLMGTRSASDAEYQNNVTKNRIMSNATQAPRLGFGAAHQAENNLMSKLLLGSVLRQASMAQAESAERMAKDNARQSFSILA